MADIFNAAEARITAMLTARGVRFRVHTHVAAPTVEEVTARPPPRPSPASGREVTL